MRNETGMRRENSQAEQRKGDMSVCLGDGNSKMRRKDKNDTPEKSEAGKRT